jgi:hypothetical protein
VPFAADDFATEAERDLVLRPWKITDADGRVLPHWLGARPIFLPKGRLAPVAMRPAPAAATGDAGDLALQGS